METIPFSYAYAYVNPGLHGLSYACAYACVVRVNQALVKLIRKLSASSTQFVAMYSTNFMQ